MFKVVAALAFLAVVVADVHEIIGHGGLVGHGGVLGHGGLVGHGGVLGHGGLVGHGVVVGHAGNGGGNGGHYDQYSEPHYEFGYSVEDKHTGDVKSQQEVRKGDQVKGAYTLLDHNGHQRVVEYQADKHNGFNANFKREHTLHVSHDHKGHVEVTGQSSHYQNSLHQNVHNYHH